MALRTCKAQEALRQRISPMLLGEVISGRAHGMRVRVGRHSVRIWLRDSVDILQIICNLKPGGAERLAVDLSCTLADSGHRVRFVIIDRGTGDDSERHKLGQLAAHGVNVQSFKRVPGSGILGLTRAIQACVACLELDRYDVIHSHLPYAHAVASATRRWTGGRMKQLLTVHTAPEVWAGWQQRLIGAQPIVYCSQVAWSRGKHAPESAWVVPNGVNLAAFAPAGPTADPLADLAIPAGRRRIISVGSIIPSKNYAASVAAIKHLVATDDVHFLAAGAGNAAALRGESRRLGIEDRVTFLGPRADVPALLASSHLFLSASQREGMPIAVLEAFASGLPCVLTPIEEHQEVAAMVSGCLIAADSSPAALADACHRSLAAPVARAALQAARAPQLSVYSIGSCAARYQAIYQELLAR